MNMLYNGLGICNSHQAISGADRTDQFFRRSCSMDDATVLHACRLLHEALCDDLELRRLVVHVERDRVLMTIHPKHGVQERKVVVGEDSTTENVHLLDEWR